MLDNFLYNLNNKEQTIKFTIEKEQNRPSRLLHIQIEKSLDNFDTLVRLWKTYSD